MAGKNGIREVWIVWLGLLGCCAGLFLPGVAPDDYVHGSVLDVLAHKLTSERSKLPFDYYSLPFCHHDEKQPRRGVSVASIFTGERSKITGYEFRMLEEETCKVHCMSEFSARDIQKLRARIKNHYKVRMSLDGLPVTMRSATFAGRLGYPLGVVDQDKIYFYNHVRFTVLYHKVFLEDSTDFVVYRVVGFEADPLSVRHKVQPGQLEPDTCKNMESQEPLEIVEKMPLNVTFTYDVVYRESELEWATRWDALLKVHPVRRKIQWFAVANSSLLCLFLSTLIMLILLRTLRKDLFNSDLVGSEVDETGWKSLRRDVFRPPKRHVLLCILAGSGVQLVMISLVTLLIALVGFVTPEYRGRLITATISLWIFTSSVAGFCAAKLHGLMDGTRMRDVALGTAFLVPGVVFTVIFGINMLFWLAGSIGGTSVVAFIVLLFLWFCISVPLCYIGAQAGSRRKGPEPSSRYSSVPREIPQRSFLFGWPMTMVAGGLPFGVLAVELFSILNSLWQSEIYVMFSFLFFVFLIVLVVSAETSVVVSYVKLINEDYRWWWTSFAASGSTGIYVFIYSVHYLVTHQTLDGLNILSDAVVLGYMGIISMLLSVMIGSVGFLGALWFVNIIFDGLRMD